MNAKLKADATQLRPLLRHDRPLRETIDAALQFSGKGDTWGEIMLLLLIIQNFKLTLMETFVIAFGVLLFIGMLDLFIQAVGNQDKPVEWTGQDEDDFLF